MKFLKDNRGFVGLEITMLLVLSIILVISAYFLMQPTKDITNTLQYEGLILEKFEIDQEDYTDYYINVEWINKEIIKFKISKSNYDALEAGYNIKFYSYQYEDEDETYYNLGTPQSKGTIILVTNNSIQTDSE